MKKLFFIFMVVMLFIIVTVPACNKPQSNYEENVPRVNGEPTLPGALEIYPTVMVEGELYTWVGVYGMDIFHQEQGELPEESAYYGEVTHVEGETPKNNCEFVSTFQVSGQIYMLADDSDTVLLCLTTDWMENALIEFELAK